MKDAIKMVISHFFIITVCVTAAIGFSNLFSGSGEGYPREFPLHLLLIGATSALPSFLFYSRKGLNRRRFTVRTLLHFCCIVTIVLVEGYFMKWYDTFGDAAIICGIIVVVYAAVWIITLHTNNKAERSINEALLKYNKEEEAEEPQQKPFRA